MHWQAIATNLADALASIQPQHFLGDAVGPVVLKVSGYVLPGYSELDAKAEGEAFCDGGGVPACV